MRKQKGLPPDEHRDWVSRQDEDGGWVSWDEMRSDEHQRNTAARHFKDHRHPGLWWIQGCELHNVASYVFETYEQQGKKLPTGEAPSVLSFPAVAYMLAGMSIECGLKAYLLCAYDWPITDDQFNSVAKGNHDLGELLKRTLIRNNETDRDGLRQISEFVRWKGRYPLPRKLKELEANYTSKNLSSEGLWCQYMEIREKFGRRLKGEVNRYMKSGCGRS